jgi:hypothetical protein
VRDRLESDVNYASDPSVGYVPDTMPPPAARRSTRTDDDRPPFCPTCHRRLVILTTHVERTSTGDRTRYQLWGCPRGHAMSRRMHGLFSPVEILPNPLLVDDGLGEFRASPALAGGADDSRLR